MTTVALLGTFDTKGDEYAWLADRITGLGAQVLTIDVGAPRGGSAGYEVDISSDDVLAAAGADAGQLRSRRDRGETMAAMGRGAARVIARLAGEGRIHGLLAVGGSGGSSVAAPAMQAVPIGFPKLLVSTMAAGDVSPYVGEVDATLMYSVVDVAGINSVSTLVFGNAAAAITGMASAYEAAVESLQGEATAEHRPLVGLTMFGVTTPAADEARATLTDLGYEVLVFHATGTGGRAMEKLIQSGLLAGVCDLTTTELADDLVGGVLSAGPDRLAVAGAVGLPQVVSLGALDMVNFGPRDTVPTKFEQRKLFVHNPTVTLMRTTRDEMAELGRRIATKLPAAAGPTEVFIPRRGVSAIDVEGGPFRDEEADEALFGELRDGLRGTKVTVHELNQAINDPGFGRRMAQRLDHLIHTHNGP